MILTGVFFDPSANERRDEKVVLAAVAAMAWGGRWVMRRAAAASGQVLERDALSRTRSSYTLAINFNAY
jgi:hypothetical protein